MGVRGSKDEESNERKGPSWLPVIVAADSKEQLQVSFERLIRKRPEQDVQEDEREADVRGDEHLVIMRSDPSDAEQHEKHERSG
jgi:hypothetical protein